MSVILYARVSTGEQAERDLSIPAQFRAVKHLAEERGKTVTASYQDVGTGKTFRERPGLMAAIKHATTDREIEAIYVHRIDRISRNTFNYLLIKGKLRRVGVRIVSFVERVEANPMGEFLEHIMAAQAEFYSANLSMEVKKGMEERLRRGKWVGCIPLGYLRASAGRLSFDPARAPLIRRAFEEYATGFKTVTALADELHHGGLLGRNGRPVSPGQLWAMLKNPFYMGVLTWNSVRYPALHTPLVAPETFERCQEVFRQKYTSGRPRRKLSFLLAGKVVCPRCGSILIGEEHTKPSGKLYRYYRCHTKGCRFLTRATELESHVIQQILDLKIPERVIPALKRRIREEEGRESNEHSGRLRALQAQRRGLEEELRSIVQAFAVGHLSVEDFDQQEAEIKNAIKAADLLGDKGMCRDEPERGQRKLLAIAESIERWLHGADLLERRQAVDAVLSRLLLVFTRRPCLELRREWQQLLAPPGYENAMRNAAEHMQLEQKNVAVRIRSAENSTASSGTPRVRHEL